MCLIAFSFEIYKRDPPYDTWFLNIESTILIFVSMRVINAKPPVKKYYLSLLSEKVL